MLSDEVLYDRLSRGDREAFDELYRRHVRHLLAFACRRLDDAQEAEDVCHEAFIALLHHGGSPIRHVRAWLFTSTRNLCANRRRGKSRERRALDRPEPHRDNPDPESLLLAVRRDSALAAAVSSLPERLSELYRLRGEGLSYRELATRLDIPIGTVKSRMNELTRLLREHTS